MNTYSFPKSSGSTQRLFHLLMALIVLLSALGLTAGQAQAANDQAFTCTTYHTVQKGEYLSKIAKLYGVDWRWLAEINHLSNPSLIYTGSKLCIAGEGSPTVTPAPSNGPFVSIVKVIEDESVTIQLSGYPANRDVRVLMDKIGTKAVNGILVDTLRTDKNGALKVTVDIPKKLMDVSKIAIRVETRTGGYYSYNWFTNADSSDQNISNTLPFIKIEDVQSTETVTLKGQGFPAHTKLYVYMGRYGSRGENGYLVETVKTDGKGKFIKTFEVPKKLQNARRIAIRAQTRTNSYYAYNWFYNRPNP